ncbi:MAG: BMC domain-containing protein [Myxococcales bacterium]|nr:BMC domain-containing protein [Myxococcales bacterium]
MPSPSHHDTLGSLELVDVPAGLCALDALVKEAEITVYFAGDIDPGRFWVLFGGDMASCEAALLKAIAQGGRDVVETLLLPQAHHLLRSALTGSLQVATAQQELSLGIVQCHTPTSTLAAVDRALKAAEVTLVRLRVAAELAGQGHAVLSGEQHAIEAALQAAQQGAPTGVVVRTRQIARPAAEVYAAANQRPRGARALTPLDP